jgi:hypothetical protein
MAIPVAFSTDTITFYIDGVPYALDKSQPQYEDLLDELRKPNPDESRLIALTEPVSLIRDAIDALIAEQEESVDYLPRGVVSVSRNAVLYNGEQLTGVLVDRILQLLAEGFNIMPMVRFLENLFQNPAEFARDELYLWLENSTLPITEDGHFLAYKRVNANFTSIHDSRTDNSPGRVVSIPRADVDPIRAHECSTGLHFCSLSYLVNGPGRFGMGYSDSSGSKIVVLKINPADVVSIPGDYGNTKGRAWKYEVLHEVDSDPTTKVWKAVVNAAGTDVSESPLDIPSDLSKALFAALNDIGIKDREDRLDFAIDVIDDQELWEGDQDGYIESFYDLTVKQASAILAAARARKEAADNATATKVNMAQVDAINSYGIETLRREASKAGFTAATGRSPYKQANAAELRDFLIGKL